jgi:hypothetical protein
MTQSRLSRAGLFIALVTTSLIATPSMAKWPGDGASPGGALAAKAIGQECRVFNASELAELDAYLTRARQEMARTQPNFDYDKFSTKLSADYAAKYNDPNACTADATEEARDLLERVRTAIKTGRILVAQ